MDGLSLLIDAVDDLAGKVTSKLDEMMEEGVYWRTVKRTK